MGSKKKQVITGQFLFTDIVGRKIDFLGSVAVDLVVSKRSLSEKDLVSIKILRNQYLSQQPIQIVANLGISRQFQSQRQKMLSIPRFPRICPLIVHYPQKGHNLFTGEFVVF